MITTETIVRYGEIGLKGDNRDYFEQRLVSNIQNRVNVSVRRVRGRIIAQGYDPCFGNIFGIVSFSKCVKAKADLKQIKRIVNSIVKPWKGCFRVSCQRLNKNYPLNSNEIEVILGEFIVKKTGLKVKLKNPKNELGIEIINDDAYIFTERARGPGGLPVGVEGKVICLMQDKKSILAGLLAMKRGCELIPVAFKDTDLDQLNKYSNKELQLIKIRDLNEINVIAKQKNAKALIAGQTLKDIKGIDVEIPVLRPLIGFDEKEIKSLLSEYSRH